jgi:hypothetical protein
VGFRRLACTAREAPAIPTSPTTIKPETMSAFVCTSPAVGRITPPTLQPAATVSWTTIRWKVPPESPDTCTEYVYSGVEVVVDRSRLKVTLWPAPRVSLDGIEDSVGPFVTLGSTLAARLTVPEKPSTLRRVTTAAAFTPGLTHRFDGLELRLKSGDWPCAAVVAITRDARITSDTAKGRVLFRFDRLEMYEFCMSFNPF